VVDADRESVVAELRRHGDRLQTVRRTERDELDAIAELIPRALDAGVTKRDIARLTGVGRPWIDRVLRDRGAASDRE
jgi:hypothetical protein